MGGLAGSAERPVVACYCATFLKPEMLHIYRQIVGLERVQPMVIAQKREEEARFPFRDVTLVRKPPAHFLRRFRYRQLRDAPWQMSSREREMLLAVLGSRKAKLLHIYFGHIAVHLLPLMRAAAAPSVVSFHGADAGVDLQKPAYRQATREMLAAARLVLVRSDSLGQALRDLGCDAAKIRVHRTGIPIENFEFRERVWPKDGAWQLLQAGRLIEKKGIAVSLRAFARFATRFPRARFTIAGDGPLRDQLKRAAKSLGLSDRVRFTGFVPQKQLRELFYDSHIFLHPSQMTADGNREGVPNSMLEAMATGLPVFATRHGGIPEAIEDGASGVLVAERDEDALSEALLEWTQRPDELSALAGSGAATVRKKFEQQAQVRQLEDYYFEAIGTTPPAAAG